MGGEFQVVDHLYNNNTSVVFAVYNHQLFIAHLGQSLGETDIPPSLLSRGVLGGGLDTEIVPALFPSASDGWTGTPGCAVSRDGHQLPVALRYLSHSRERMGVSTTFTLVDAAHNLRVNVTVTLHESNVITFSSQLANDGSSDIAVNSLSLCLPIAEHAGELLTLGGRHAMEAVQHRTPWNRTQHLIENRTGRTSHEQLAVVFAGTDGFSEQSGDVWGVHLAWSGNFRFVCDGVTEHLKTIHIGELVQAGEVVVPPNHTYDSPDIVVSYSSHGLTPVSQQFHEYVRSFASTTHHPIVLNTWEAVYFNHNLETLSELATAAADVGIERFVLDDGWFHGRRDDTAGLGDWWVDNTVWPDGLDPLVRHVTSLGMEFGLWFEPEMVNPSSELFRSHPDWALDGTLPHPLTGRHQLVLNMARDDVREYLFQKIDALLTTYDISYVKWDHNRPLVGGAAHHQTHGFYSLLSRLIDAHPRVQFESCASGGGRIDMAVARYVKRFWASDSIDALDRLEIQKGLTTFIPPEMLGAHIGSPTCHTTGRKHALSFRAASALFHWHGVEWNLLALNQKEKDGLTAALRFYKEHRSLIHSGHFVRVDHNDSTIDIRGVIHPNHEEALFTVSRLRSGPSNHSTPLRFPVDANTTYSVTLMNLGTPRWALHRELPQWITDQHVTVSGHVLATMGLAMPSLLPESSFVVHVKAVAVS